MRELVGDVTCAEIRSADEVSSAKAAHPVTGR
jgi:hypothetical protein